MQQHCHCSPFIIENVGGLCTRCGGRTHEASMVHKAESKLFAANTGIERAQEWLASIKSTESKEAAYRTAASRALAEELAARAHARDPSRSMEWHLGMVYQQRPELYESENRVSDLASKRRYAATPSDVGL